MLVRYSGLLARPTGASHGTGGDRVPTGRGEARDRKQKKKSKEQLEKELTKKPATQPLQPPMTVEVIKPKRKAEEDW
jgi:hypothetical protein